MFNLLMLNMIFLLILFLMLMINFMISKKDYKNREKISSFECGFDSMCNNRLPFSLQFYLISVIFLIFDVEIALILPMVKLMNFNIIYFVFISMIVMIILFIGLMIEFKEGALTWIKLVMKN